MTADEMIAVIAGAEAGKVIQYRELGPRGDWMIADHPLWDFSHWNYRIKPEPREWWVNEYEDDNGRCGYAYPTLDRANKASMPLRISCKRFVEAP